MQAQLALVVLVASFVSGMCVQSFMDDARHNESLVQAQNETASIKRGWDLRLAEQRQEYANEIASINDDRDDLLERLRKRPGRLPNSSRSACTGSTGAELSAEDGSFLVGIAAEADTVAARLTECQGWIDSVTGKSDQ